VPQLTTQPDDPDNTLSTHSHKKLPNQNEHLGKRDEAENTGLTSDGYSKIKLIMAATPEV